MFCNHQNSKIGGLYPWANNLPLFDDDKTYELFNKKNGKRSLKAPPQIMLYIKNMNFTERTKNGMRKKINITNKWKRSLKAPPQIMLKKWHDKEKGK